MKVVSYPIFRHNLHADEEAFWWTDHDILTSRARTLQRKLTIAYSDVGVNNNTFANETNVQFFKGLR